MGMKRYLNQITVAQAVQILRNTKPVKSVHTMPLIESVGQILAESVYAEYTVPEVPVSAMDGFAVRSSDTVSASDQKPVELTSFVRVNTGNVVPPEFDAVVKIEDTWFEEGSGPDTITIRRSVNPGINVRMPGEDIRKGSLILPAGSVIRPFDIGALASYGITHVPVAALHVGIIPTGNELINPGETPAPGQVVESNTIMAEAYLRQFGVGVVRYPPVEDNPVLIRGALDRAVEENGIVIISAGSSVGTRDFTAKVIAEAGSLIFHGVAMKPAKPVLYGLVRNKPVFGLPGYPLSAQTVLRVFVAELLEAWGWSGPEKRMVTVRLGDSVSSEGGIDEFSLQAVGRIEDHYAAIPQGRGASVQMTGVRANAIIRIPYGVEGLEAGSDVSAVLLVPKAELDRTVLIAGIYDPSLEPLMELSMKKNIRIRTGSFSGVSGILLLLKKSCHATCITDDADLAPLAGMPYAIIPLTKTARLVCWKSSLDDPMLAEIAGIAASAEYQSAVLSQ
jgi:putative molybdopterin biosynthesis protein